MTQTVFVTGATGFIAQHIIDQLLKEDYKVIGSVRTSQKGDTLVKLYNNPNFSYEIIEDLTNSEDDFDNALKAHPEIEVVLHTASPVNHVEGDNEKNFLYPAINGSKNALNAVNKYGLNVKRFVYTSSNSAVHSRNREGPNFVENEDSWNDITWEQALNGPSLGYAASKTFAEKEVWDFIKKNKVSFEVSVVNPVFVFGPQVFDEFVQNELNFSNEFINSFFTQGENYKRFQGSFTDVRDVAKAHLYAFQKENTIGKRLILKDSTFTEQTLLDIINEKFPEINGKISKGNPGSDKPILSQRVVLDNTKTRDILGFKFIPLEKSLYDTVAQIIKVRGL